MGNRTRMLLGIVAIVVASGAAGWVASSSVRSPAELAARTAPPDASLILVPAEQRVLSSDIVTRGTARFGSPQQLYLTVSSLKPDAGIASGLPLPASELREGDLLLISSGRPVFLLTGERPSFRDLGPGVEGDDVRQLEAALERMGFEPGPADGVFDAATEAAVKAWYERYGFAAFEASATQLDALRALNADSAGTQVELAAARDAVAVAQAALNGVIDAKARAGQAVEDAELAVDATIAITKADNKAAAAEVEIKKSALALLTGQSGTLITEISIARAELEVAEAAAAATKATGESSVAAARAAVADAQAEDARLAGEITVAEAAMRNATSVLAVRLKQTELTGSDLSRAMAQTGVQVPSDEIIFVASTPVRVAELAISAGEVPSGAVMTVTSAVVAVDGGFRLDEATLARVGMTVQIDEPGLNISESGVISRLAESPGTNGVDGFHVWFEVLVDGAPASLVGASRFALSCPWRRAAARSWPCLSVR